jgi:hypothetical protein
MISEPPHTIAAAVMGALCLVGVKHPWRTRDPQVARLNAEALRLRRRGLSYKEIARSLGAISEARARLRALKGLRDEARRLGKRYYHLNHDTYLNWRDP